MARSLASDGNAVTDLKRCTSRKVVPASVADVARLQVAPQKLPNSGESGYSKVRHGVARMGCVSCRFCRLYRGSTSCWLGKARHCHLFYGNQRSGSKFKLGFLHSSNRHGVRIPYHPLPDSPMKRISLLALLFTALLSSNAQGDFFIDNFSILDSVGGPATSIGSSGINVAVSDNTGTTTALFSDDVNNRYQFTANNVGDSFVVAYDFPGVFNDLQSVSGNQLTQSPGSFFGDWTMTIDTGVGTPASFGPTIPTILGSPIDLDSASELTFTFTYNGGSTFPGGAGVGIFGGPSNPLFATPEPTAFMMLGTAGLIVLFPRRRKS